MFPTKEEFGVSRIGIFNTPVARAAPHLAGGTSHLFSHVFDNVGVKHEMFALDAFLLLI
ncbi:hypothetical protein SDC9_48961 [bioreactor metagenome]|uniref:Uncharacterized protein n=1 Tax=bioreactor metagenome TaxID=1076179 RepID=A0A644WFT0_9ZZZZ